MILSFKLTFFFFCPVAVSVSLLELELVDLRPSTGLVVEVDATAGVVVEEVPVAVPVPRAFSVVDLVPVFQN